ncbi:proline-rich transmembrane protein 4-like [Neosynchiropus ocellatus]
MPYRTARSRAQNIVTRVERLSSEGGSPRMASAGYNQEPACSAQDSSSAGGGAKIVSRDVSPTTARSRQHVTASLDTDASMLPPHLVALCVWGLLLADRRAVADEEALWGTTPSARPTDSKAGSYWWTPPRLRFPPLPSLPFRVPFLQSPSQEEAAVTEPIDRLLEGSGSGDGSVLESTETPTVSSPESPASVTETRRESTVTSDPPHGSEADAHNATLVSDSHFPTRSFITNHLFSQSPARAGPPEPTATHTVTPVGATLAAGHRSVPTTPPSPAQAPTPGGGSRVTTTHPGAQSDPPTTDPVSTTVDSTAPTVREIHDDPWTLEDERVFSEARSEPAEERSSSTAEDLKTGSIGSTTTRSRGDPAVGELPLEEGEEEAEVVAMAADSRLITRTTAAAGQSSGSTEEDPDPSSDDWESTTRDGAATFLPDCNQERSGVCNVSDPWASATPQDPRPTQNSSVANQSSSPFVIPAPLMLVPLYADWNSAMAAWGLAWQAHVYGAGCLFVTLTIASALNLLCLPLRCPSGCGYFALVSLFLLAVGLARSFSLLYDAYGHQDRLPSTEASLLLYEAPFPCLTAAFGLVFLLLSMRSRMQLSYSAFQRPCFLACLVVLHFAAAFGPATLLKFYQQKPPLCLFLSLVARGAFVTLATFLSLAYFVFYIYVRADSKHIYHLNNTSPTPAERYNRCPFAESRDWDRAAVTVCLSALFCLACAGLQLYAMLNAMGVAGGKEVFHPWPWWAFQLGCRLCELGLSVSLALVVAQPVYCSDHLPSAGSCWTELLASKSPILPGSYQWSLSNQEKLAIVDTVGLGESESLPLYTLMDERLAGSMNGLDLLYHSNRALAYRDLDLDFQGSDKHGNGGLEMPSGGSSFASDSTTDLRPPSPINLRRSIDEALFGEALFPMSLFSPPSLYNDVSNYDSLPSKGHCDPADPGLFRTSSCIEFNSEAQATAQGGGEVAGGAPPSPSSSNSSSPERWRGSSSSCSLYRTSIGGSSLVLGQSPEGARDQQQTRDPGDPQSRYQTLGAPSQESLDLSSEADRSVHEEFISVCRQIDAMSVSSETIDL